MTDKVIDARKVFIDTEVYNRNAINFSNETFLRLQSLVNEGKIELFSSSITINEIKANISDSICESKKAIEEFQTKARYLRNTRAFRRNKIWKEQDYDKLVSDLNEQVDEFMDKTGTRLVNFDGINIQEIFSKYFANHPPFKEGKKKYEFPDAFVIASMKQMSRQINQQIFVISGDSDWQRACEGDGNLVWLEKPDALFQLIEFDDRLIAEQADNIFNRYNKEISSKVADDFKNLGFSIDGSNYSRTIGNENVNEVTVDNVAEIEKFLVRVNDDKMIFKCNYQVHFRANIEFEDYTYASYDSEERQFYSGDWVDNIVESTENIPVEVIIPFTREEPIQSRLESVKIQINGNCSGR